MAPVSAGPAPLTGYPPQSLAGGRRCRSDPWGQWPAIKEREDGRGEGTSHLAKLPIPPHGHRPMRRARRPGGVPRRQTGQPRITGLRSARET
jgi:hypothetical protein